jgi:type I restriction enzyme S subunit
MHPERLLQHFDRISEVPDAIPRLRQFILDLAVRGKLVEQNPNDEPAEELLRRIEVEKARLTRERKLRPQAPLPKIAADQEPFQLPKGWAWAYLGEVIALLSGQHLQPNEYSDNKQSGPPYVTGPADFSANGLIISRYALVRKAVATKGQLLLTVKGAGVGKTTTCDIPEVAISRQLMALTAIRWNQHFLSLTTHLLAETLRESARSLIPGISRDDVELFVFGLPPLAEQHRIVAKVDELMALCDQLEAAKIERAQSRDRLVAASLHHLISPADAEEADTPEVCRDHARFIFNHLSRLTTCPEHIKQLRQTILNLAVCGKLVPQASNDGPVSSQLALNDHSRKETAQRDRRADSGLQQFLVAEEKWEVPVSWEWRAVADIALFIDYRGKTPSKMTEGIRLITAKNVRKGFISLVPEEFLSESNYMEWMTRGIPQEGDVLFTTEAPMGNAAVVRLKERFALAQRVINFRPYGALDPDFLVLQLLAEPFQAILDKTATGLTAKGIKAAKLKRLPITIPPLTEQHRIVAKVDELMALCDQLEAQLTTTEADSRRLLEAVLHEALAPALEETA